MLERAKIYRPLLPRKDMKKEGVCTSMEWAAATTYPNGELTWWEGLSAREIIENVSSTIVSINNL